MFKAKNHYFCRVSIEDVDNPDKKILTIIAFKSNQYSLIQRTIIKNSFDLQRGMPKNAAK